MEIPTYITLDYPAGVSTPSIQESLGRIAAALERLTQLENFVAQTLTLTPLNNPQNLNLNLNSLNSSEDSEIKITSGDGMQGKGGTPSRPRRSGFGAGRRLLPKDFEFDERALQLGLGLGYTQPQVHQRFNAFRDYYHAEGKMKSDWQAAFRNWLRKDRRDNGDPQRGLR